MRCERYNCNGFELMYFSDSSLSDEGVLIEFNEKNIEAIRGHDLAIFDALNELYDSAEVIRAFNAIYDMRCCYRDCEFNIRDFNMSFSGQKKLYDQANLVLNHASSNEDDKKMAASIIDNLENGPPPYKPVERTPEEKAKRAFDKRKPKIRLKLVIRDGYRCVHCGQDEEDSLCVVQKEKDDFNYELDNLVFKCRKCLNKK